jgi:hypothetical protein
MKRRSGESGQAVLAATIIVSLVLLMLLTMITQTQLGNRLVSRQLTYQGQAANAAQAGLVDALSWFRRQSTQPVKTFAPAVNSTANPPINDTDDTTIGIVRTYEVSGPAHLMGRYEVRKGIPLTSTSPDAGSGVLDITSQKGKTNATAGSIWQLESVGYIWVQNDPSNPNYDQNPNTVLSKQTFRTEIQKMSVNLPDGGAALFSANCDNVKIGNKTKIQGGTGIGVSCKPGSGLGITNNGIINGTTKTKTNSTAPYDILAVLSVTPQELQGLADVNVTQVKDLPNPLPGMSLIVINGNAVFGPASATVHPLAGSGILVVYGDLTVQSDTSNFWNGVIYVTYSSAAPSSPPIAQAPPRSQSTAAATSPRSTMTPR